MTQTNKTSGKGTMSKLIGLGLIFIGLFAGARLLPVEQWLKSFNDWAGHIGIAGIFVFIAVYACATVLLAPGSILTIGAGFAFGLWKGFLAVSAGATLGATLAFLISRFIARDKIQELAKRNENFQQIDSAIGKQGATLVFLLRLSPIIPFNLSNYLYGLTAVKFWPYVLASWIGMMPGTFLYVYLGTLGKAGVDAAAGGGNRSMWQWTALGVGLAATVIVTVWVTRMAQGALRKSAVTES